LTRRERGKRVEVVLREAQLPPAVWNRRPSELSGGEAQRLALARALAPEPELLLLDEPLAQVDTTLRAELLDLISRVIRARRVTAVYVTHHWREATELCQRIEVMRSGRIETEATPEDIVWHPPTPEIARLTGPIVELPQQLLQANLITCAEGSQSAKATMFEESNFLTIRPQQLRLIEPEGENRWELVECRPDGAGWSLILAHAGRRLPVASTIPLQLGQSVGVELRTAKDCSLHLVSNHGKKVVS